MSDEASVTRSKLRPWFWGVLFLTPVFSLVANSVVAATTQGEG